MSSVKMTSSFYVSDFEIVRSNLGAGLVLNDIDTTTNKLYFTQSDEVNQIGTIKEYDKTSNQFRILAGNGVQGNFSPSGRALDISLGSVKDARPFNRILYFLERSCIIRQMSLIEMNPLVVTVAGVIDHCGEYNGENVTATVAYIGPIALYVDSAGAIYFGDSSYRIRTVVNGKINTIVGTGSYETSGSFKHGISYPARTTDIGRVTAIALDSSSKLFFISDNVLLQLNGDSFTLVGPDPIVSDLQLYNGDGFNASLASHARITNLWIDAADNIYTVDDYRVRIVSKQTNIIHTIIGTGVDPTAAPANGADPIRTAIPRIKSRVVVDNTGGIYFYDDSKYYSLCYFHRHFPSQDTGRRIFTIAGGLSSYYGDGHNAHLSGFDILGPIWVDSRGMIYLTDSQDPQDRVRKIDPDSHVISTIAGSNRGYVTGLPTTSKLNGPIQVWGTTDEKMYVLERNNRLIRRFDLTNLSSPMTIVAGDRGSSEPDDGEDVTSTSIGTPHRMWMNTAGELYLTDSWNCNAYEVNAAGKIYRIVGMGDYGTAEIGPTSRQTQIGWPEGIIGDTVGNIYIGMTSTGAVVYKLNNRTTGYDYSIEYYAGGNFDGWGFGRTYNGDNLPATSTNFLLITGIGIDKDSNLYVLDSGLNVIRVIDPVTKITTIIAGKAEENTVATYFGDGYSALGAGIVASGGLFVDSVGGIYLTGSGSPRSVIRYITPASYVYAEPTFAPTLAPVSATSSSSTNEISDLEVFYIAFFPGVAILLVIFSGLFYYFCYKKGLFAPYIV